MHTQASWTISKYLFRIREYGTNTIVLFPDFVRQICDFGKLVELGYHHRNPFTCMCVCDRCLSPSNVIP